jgi:heterodisulfide reductase subunit C
MGERQEQYPKGALVRLTNDEHMRLTALAKKAELSFSRFLVESGLTGQAPTNEDRIQRERAILQLARVGNNLNQIARQLNAQRGALSFSDITETLEEVRTALERIEVKWQRGKP